MGMIAQMISDGQKSQAEMTRTLLELRGKAPEGKEMGMLDHFEKFLRVMDRVRPNALPALPPGFDLAETEVDPGAGGPGGESTLFESLIERGNGGPLASPEVATWPIPSMNSCLSCGMSSR